MVGGVRRGRLAAERFLATPGANNMLSTFRPWSETALREAAKESAKETGAYLSECVDTLYENALRDAVRGTGIPDREPADVLASYRSTHPIPTPLVPPGEGANVVLTFVLIGLANKARDQGGTTPPAV